MRLVGLASLLLLCVSACGSGSGGRICDYAPSYFFQPELGGPPLGLASQLSMDEYCRVNGCGSREETLSWATIRVTGCGIESLQWRQGDLAGRLVNYDAATGELVGAAFNTSGQGNSGCEEPDEQTGEGPPLHPDDFNHPSGEALHRTPCEEIMVEDL